MRFHFSEQDDAFYVRFSGAPYAESDEVREGVIFDYDRNKKLIGIEILDASKRFPKGFSAKLPRSVSAAHRTKPVAARSR